MKVPGRNGIRNKSKLFYFNVFYWVDNHFINLERGTFALFYCVTKIFQAYFRETNRPKSTLSIAKGRLRTHEGVNT